jgi:CheY-like chemotaxis protein
LVEELLDISRIVSGKLQLEVKPVNLTETINSAVESIRPAATGKSIEVEISNDFPDAAVPGDVDRLQQVFWNLLTNAVKFTPNNGRISLTVKEVGSFCEISVKDTGRGISPDFLPFVFERFRQADRFFSGPRAGLGLGLAITQHLVEAHGGTIQAFSEGEGQGATFVVQFPVLAEQHDLKFPAVTTPALARNHAAQERLKDLRILMVDDDPDACEVVRTILEEHGAIVTTAFSASEAFQILQKEKPDLLISDIIMPEENGYQFIRRVRSFEKESGVRIPAVALTAKARVEDRLEALSAGFQIHVPKPVEPAELEVVVANLAGRDKFIM